jgi:hypothetical protein
MAATPQIRAKPSKIPGPDKEDIDNRDIAPAGRSNGGPSGPSGSTGNSSGGSSSSSDGQDSEGGEGGEGGDDD